MQIGEIRDLERSLQGRARLQVHPVAEDAEGHRRPVRHRLQAVQVAASQAKPLARLANKSRLRRRRQPVRRCRRRDTYPQRLHSAAAARYFDWAPRHWLIAFLPSGAAALRRRESRVCCVSRAVRMRRSESQRPVLSSGASAPRRAAVAVALALPLAGCFLGTEQIRRRPRHPAGLSRRRRASADAALPSVAVVARLPLQGADRSDRGGADLQSRHRGRGRAHRAGRRAGAHRRRGAAAGDRLQRPTALAASRTGPAGRDRATPSPTSLSASYEIDFWGKNRAALRAAEETRGREPLRPRGGGAHHRRRASPTPISRCCRRTIACASRATISPPPRACST